MLSATVEILFPTPRKSEHPRSRTAGTCFRTVTSLARGGAGRGGFRRFLRVADSWFGGRVRGVPGRLLVRSGWLCGAGWGPGTSLPEGGGECRLLVRSGGACRAVFASAGSSLRGLGWCGAGARVPDGARLWGGAARGPFGVTGGWAPPAARVAWGGMSAGCSRGAWGGVRVRRSRVHEVGQCQGGRLRGAGSGPVRARPRGGPARVAVMGASVGWWVGSCVAACLGGTVLQGDAWDRRAWPVVTSSGCGPAGTPRARSRGGGRRPRVSGGWR